jgi:TonB family protein
MNLPTATSVNVDSIVRASAREREARADQLGTRSARSAQLELSTTVPRSTDGDESIGSRPTIIGRVPAARYPESIRAIWPVGEVVVRFEVNAQGRVNIGSMTVVRSDHELFTAAVRDILPLLRFEPARLPPPDSRPVADWVELPFNFSAKR